MRGNDEGKLLPKNQDDVGRMDLNYIQGLRFLVVIWILVFHYLDWSEVKSDEVENLIGNRPLDLFIIISGFVTHLAYGRRKEIGGCFYFLGRRASKIAFMYYATGLVSFCLSLFSMSYRGKLAWDFFHRFLVFIPWLFGLNAWWSIILVFYPLGKPSIPEPLHSLATSVYPDNGPLWFIQALAFCWFTYPVVRNWLPGQNSDRTRNIAALVLLWVVAVVPGAIGCLAGKTDDKAYITFLKVFPPFMVPSFYLGAVAYDLYTQEKDAVRESRKAPDWHTQATLIGELLFCLFLFVSVFLWMSPLLRYHIFSLVFGFVLILFGIASVSEKQSRLRLGFRWFLETEAVMFLGDLSLYIYTLQAPLNTLFFWTMGTGIHAGSHAHWMGPIGFMIFTVSLYALAYFVSRFVDKPITKWLSAKINETTEPISNW